MPKDAGWYRNERTMHQKQAPRLMRKQKEERERREQEKEQEEEQDVEIIQLGFVDDLSD